MKKNRLRILMFAPGFAPYDAPENIVNSKLALAFIEEGWEVRVISKSEEEYHGTGWKEPWLPLKDITYEIKSEKESYIKRYFNRLLSLYKMRYPIAGVQWAKESYNIAQKIHTDKPFDIVLSRATPFCAHLPAMVFAAKTGLPWIANWNDPPSGSYYEVIELYELERFYKKENFIENKFLNKVASKASIHIFPSERQARLICNHLNIEKHRSIVIPHVALKAQKNYSNSNDGVFKICHAGSIHKGRNSDALLYAIARFLKNRKGSHEFMFNIVGNVDESFQRNVAKYSLERFVNYAGKMNYIDTLSFIASQDILVVIEPTLTESVILPCKLIDYIQTGRPIFAIAPLQSTLYDIICKHGGGVFADCRSAESINESLSELYRLWEKGEIETVYGSGCLYDMFSPEKIVNMYKQIFEYLIKEI